MTPISTAARTATATNATTSRPRNDPPLHPITRPPPRWGGPGVLPGLEVAAGPGVPA